jgi:hypothetical protein
MSKAITIAEAMAARINVQMTLPDVSAFVDRQKDLLAEINLRVAKAGGAAIAILFEGFSNADTSSSVNLTVLRRYTVTIYAKPVLRDATETAADDIVEIVARALHNWEPDEAKVGCAEITVKGCDLIPDNRYLTYALDIECVSRL